MSERPRITLNTWPVGATVTLAILKLCGDLNWHWWAVLLPALAAIATAGLFHLAAFSVALYRHLRRP